MNFSKRKIDLHVIDALDSDSASNGRSEALALRYQLRDTSIPIISYYAWDVATLAESIKKVGEYRKQYKNTKVALPFLHIACHGVRDGLIIGDDIPVSWNDLLEMLLPLQKKVDYTLPLMLSSCHGYWGYRLALQQRLQEFKKTNPCYMLIGPQSSLTTKELVLSTATFYRSSLIKGKGLPQSVQESNSHIGDPNAALAYTYGTDVVKAFNSHGIDDQQLFRPKLPGSKQ